MDYVLDVVMFLKNVSFAINVEKKYKTDITPVKKLEYASNAEKKSQ